ncbi:hypothetical protein TrCOL_g4800, partial [Triparma columacea]
GIATCRARVGQEGEGSEQRTGEKVTEKVLEEHGHDLKDDEEARETALVLHLFHKDKEESESWGRGKRLKVRDAEKWATEFGEEKIWNVEPPHLSEREDSKSRRVAIRDAVLGVPKTTLSWKRPAFPEIPAATPGEASKRWLDLAEDDLTGVMAMVPVSLITQTKLSVSRDDAGQVTRRWQTANGVLLEPLRAALEKKRDRERKNQEMEKEETFELDQLLKAFSVLHLLIFRMELNIKAVRELRGAGREGAEVWGEGNGRDSVKARLKLWEKKQYKTL